MNTKVEPKNLEHVVETQKPIFIATYPDKNNNVPKYFQDLEQTKKYILLHPSFAYASEFGHGILNKLGLSVEDLPKGVNHIDNVMRQDIFGVKQSNFVIYDIDAAPGSVFLTSAVIFEKPILAISQTLNAAPDYFSGSIKHLIKPNDLLDFLPYFCENVVKDTPDKAETVGEKYYKVKAETVDKIAEEINESIVNKFEEEEDLLDREVRKSRPTYQPNSL